MLDRLGLTGFFFKKLKGIENFSFHQKIIFIIEKLKNRL